MWSFFINLFGLTSRMPAPVGPFPVASTHFRIPSGTFAQFFYPTNPKGESSASRKSLRPEVVNGTSKYSKTPRWLLGLFLDRLPHPLPSTQPKEGKYPVLVFSHGLGGSCDVYSKMCSDIAAHGFVVVALEHEDGSASYASKSDGADIEYRDPPQNMQYTRNEVISFRKPFLDHRVTELEAAVAFITHPPSGLPDLMAQICDVMDPSMLFLGGHSFGGTSTVLSARQLPSTWKGVVLHDLWPFPLPEDALDQGIHQPCVSILSEPFSVSAEVRYTRRLLSSSADASSFKIMGSVHSSFSDSPWWFPGLIGKSAKLRGSADPLQVQADIVAITVGFLQTCVETNHGLNMSQVIKLTQGLVQVFDCGGTTSQQMAVL